MSGRPVPALLGDHFVLLVLLATLLASFLTLLWKHGARERRRFFLKVWLAFVAGAVAAGWLMLAVPHGR